MSIGEELRKLNVSGKKVAVQIPEGVKGQADVVIKALKEGGAREVLLFIDPAYGACDLKDSEARSLGAEVLVHVGHNRFGRGATEIPVEYAPLPLNLDLQKVVDSLKNIDGRVALCATVHYTHYLKKIQENIGERIVVGRSVLTGVEGQVLGCDPSACCVDADVNVVITDGIFHGIMVKMQTGRKTYILTPNGMLINVEKHIDTYLRQRETAKLLASRAKSVGIVITTKKGQKNVELAETIVDAVRNGGAMADLLVCDYFVPEYVKGMPYDVYVFTGCPRVPIDDYSRFDKPLLTVAEALEVWKGEKE